MARVNFEQISVVSPKRRSRGQDSWHGFFPYYAGFPEEFAAAVISSVSLKPGAIVLDPWNGSGTTTYAASRLGHDSVASDLNPVMLIVAKARLLDPVEADHIEPLAAKVVERSRQMAGAHGPADPLLTWFTPGGAANIRSMEKAIREHVVGPMTLRGGKLRLDYLSGTAATLYVALFTVCRELTASFRSSNPTWLRRPKINEPLAEARKADLEHRFQRIVCEMAQALANETGRDGLFGAHRGRARIVLGDTTQSQLCKRAADLVVTSPPYCTRIDYTGATRVELAVLWDLCGIDVGELSRRMIGSTRVPDRSLRATDTFGPTCRRFLQDLRVHSSKASSTYYYRTHVDYFRKMTQSLRNVRAALRPGGGAVIVVQDSFYKDLHNDLPKTFEEIGQLCGLRLDRRDDFTIARTMAGVNPGVRSYRKTFQAVEAVLCFSRI